MVDKICLKYIKLKYLPLNVAVKCQGTSVNFRHAFRHIEKVRPSVLCGRYAHTA